MPQNSVTAAAPVLHDAFGNQGAAFDCTDKSGKRTGTKRRQILWN
jgi:hypothetical protein